MGSWDGIQEGVLDSFAVLCSVSSSVFNRFILFFMSDQGHEKITKDNAKKAEKENTYKKRGWIPRLVRDRRDFESANPPLDRHA